MNAQSFDLDAVGDEIVAAFHDVPRPDRYVPEDFVAYDDTESLEYLEGKTWLEIASDVQFMTLHYEDQFFYMTEECFFYFFPGYLLGTVRHDFALTEGVVNHLLWILTPSRSWEWLFSWLSAKLTTAQKTAVAHWLRLQLERDRERRPGVYTTGSQTFYQIAFAKWQQWA